MAGCGSEMAPGRELASFSFTDQDGRSFGTDELQGHIWVANFIFTNCETVCPPMTMEMASLQKMAEENSLDIQFVTFTVDPDVDSPKVLKKYIQHFTENESNWHLLTGYSQKEIERFALEQFQTIVQKPKTSNQVIHGTNFYLIDPNGRLLKEYNFADDSYQEDLLKDMERLTRLDS
ncbi:SCO family protein [Bacillus sp. OxB-1]|uniref:SCO family protein n=1 Tax=Bacillus sp. (strain OxB-1) TaxID=98228 RepID=UPI000697900E|nr:SCO family protein [Bacillus sp. OxB-1]